MWARGCGTCSLSEGHGAVLSPTCRGCGPGAAQRVLRARVRLVVQRAPGLPRPPRRPVQGGSSFESARATPPPSRPHNPLSRPGGAGYPPLAHILVVLEAPRSLAPAHCEPARSPVAFRIAARPLALHRRPLRRRRAAPAGPLPPSAPAAPPAGAARGRAGHGQRRGGLRAHAAAAARPPGGHRRGAPRARAAGRERGAQRRPRRPTWARAGARRAAQLANPRSLLGAAGAHLGG